MQELKVICLKKPYLEPRYINPDRKSIIACLKHSPYAIAIESTYLLHKNESTLVDLYILIKTRSPETLIVADIATVTEALRANELGANVITTTLARIPNRGGKCTSHSDHVILIKEIRSKISIPILAEGSIQDPHEACALLEAGATSVVIGYAIINPLTIAQRFNTSIQQKI
jgi:N-acylglucosamine-6-phosphate 2-epimerase